MEGYIKLHRKSLESAVFQNPNLWQVWCYCLLRANHKGTKILWNKREEILKAGSFITGRVEGAKDCNMKPTTFYLQLKTLDNLNCIKIVSRNKFSVVSIVNWGKYQIDDNNNTVSNPINKRRNEDEPDFNDNRMTTDRQQNDTDKNDKNEKNNKRDSTQKTLFDSAEKYTKEERAKFFSEKVYSNNGYGKEDLRDFIEYWTESGENDKKMRFEKEIVFDYGRRLKTWMRNKEKWNGSNHKKTEAYLEDF